MPSHHRSRRSLAVLAASWAVGIFTALITPADAAAYPTYSSSKVQGQPTGSCVTCHGDFRDDPYLREGVDQGWGTDLMSGHRDVIDECKVCHLSNKYPTSLSASDGFNSQFMQSCLGCHGRFEPSLASFESSGLRQRHYRAGVTECAQCHPSDSNPAVFTPVGEDVLPANYDLTLSVVSLTDPCNPMDAGEDFAGSLAGLDNDGDGLFDGADTIDCPEPGAELLHMAALASLAIIARRRSQSWGAS